MKPTPTPDQLRPWPFHGYAPGGYLCTCRICSVSFQGDKRAMVCLSCAVVEAKKEQAADLPAAPEGWREALKKIASMRWHEDADLDDICTIADRAISAALSVPAAAVVGEPVAYYEEDDGEKILYWPHTNGVFEHIRDYPSAHADRPRPLYAAPPAPDGWQSIETPPEDWVDVLLYDPNYPNDHRKVLEGYFDGADGWVSADREKVSPTHWRPLPAPPALGGASHE